MDWMESYRIDDELDTFYEVGYISKAHGIRGEVFIRLFNLQAEWLDQAQSLELTSRVQHLGKVHRLSIQSQRRHKEGVICKFTEVNTRNAAEDLKGWTVLLNRTLLTSEANKNDDLYLLELEGFRLVDKKEGEIGIVNGFLVGEMQDLLEVSTPEGVLQVPYVDDFIIRIDREKRLIEMDLPEGLTELVDRTRK